MPGGATGRRATEQINKKKVRVNSGEPEVVLGPIYVRKGGSSDVRPIKGRLG